MLSLLKDISVECEPTFHPFLAQCYDRVTNLLDYHNYDVWASTIEAAGYFLIAYHRAGTAEAEVNFTEGWSVLQDRGQGGGRARGRYRRPRHPQ